MKGMRSACRKWLIFNIFAKFDQGKLLKSTSQQLYYFPTKFTDLNHQNLKNGPKNK